MGAKSDKPDIGISQIDRKILKILLALMVKRLLKVYLQN